MLFECIPQHPPCHFFFLHNQAFPKCCLHCLYTHEFYFMFTPQFIAMRLLLSLLYFPPLIVKNNGLPAASSSAHFPIFALWPSFIVAHSLSFLNFQGLTSFLTIPFLLFFCFLIECWCTSFLHPQSFALLTLPIAPGTNQSRLASTAIIISLHQTFYPTVIDTSNARYVILDTYLSPNLNLFSSFW